MNIKNFVVLLITALVAATAMGRELTLREITTESMRLDANNGKGLRRDAVGNKCALLKVELPVSGAIFEGTIMGDVEYHGVTYMVYVPEGTRQIRIMLDGYLTLPVDLTSESSPSGVKGGQVYYIVVDGYEDAPRIQTQQRQMANNTELAYILDDGNMFSNGKVITYDVHGVKFNMVCVEGGGFMMGADSNDSEAKGDEKPRHLMSVENFQVGQTEVTQGLWKAVMGSNPSYFQKGDDYPVEQVSWEDCQTFISKLNAATGKKFRLPTEVEWEYAARGGNNSRNFKYSGSNNNDEVAWHENNSEKTSHPVGRKKANELGLYDMSGNVWEWCQNCFESYPNHELITDLFRQGRGGCWNAESKYCRVTCRGNLFPSESGYALGFRIAL